MLLPRGIDANAITLTGYINNKKGSQGKGRAKAKEREREPRECQDFFGWTRLSVHALRRLGWMEREGVNCSGISRPREEEVSFGSFVRRYCPTHSSPSSSLFDHQTTNKRNRWELFSLFTLTTLDIIIITFLHHLASLLIFTFNDISPSLSFPLSSSGYEKKSEPNTQRQSSSSHQTTRTHTIISSLFKQRSFSTFNEHIHRLISTTRTTNQPTRSSSPLRCSTNSPSLSPFSLSPRP